MNIKPEIDCWLEKLDISLKKLYRKKKIISQNYTQNIFKIQELLSANQKFIQDSFSIREIESYFCYSKSSIQGKSTSYSDSIVNHIPIKLDKNNDFYKFYFQDLELISNVWLTEIESITQDNNINLILFRNLQYPDLNFSNITVETIAKCFLQQFETNKKNESEISYSFVFNLYKSLSKPENVLKIKKLNKNLRESLNNFLPTESNIFFNFELFQEVYTKTISTIKKNIISIDKLIEPLKTVINIPIVGEYKPTNLHKIKGYIQKYIDSKKNDVGCQIYQNKLIVKYLNLHQQIKELLAIDLSQKTLNFEENNKRLQEKIKTIYDPSINILRRNNKLLNFRPSINFNFIQNQSNNNEYIIQNIQENEKELLNLNLSLFKIKKKISENQNTVIQIDKKLDIAEKIFYFKYNHDKKVLAEENRNLKHQKINIEKQIQEKNELLQTLLIFEKNTKLDYLSLQETMEYKNHLQKKNMSQIQNTHQNSYVRYKKYRYFQKINTENIQKNKLKLEDIKKKVSLLKDKKIKLGNQIEQNGINQKKIDSVVEIYNLELILEKLENLVENMKYLTNTKKELESKRFELDNKKIHLDLKLEDSVISFVVEDNEYQINLNDIFNKLILFWKLNLNFKIIKNKIDIPFQTENLLDFKKIELKILKLETKLNPIYIKLKKEEEKNRYDKMLKKLDRCFKENTYLFQTYLREHKNLHKINLIIDKIESKNKKLKTLQNIILNI